MNAFWIGYVLGIFVGSILVPGILALILEFTPLKRKPGIVYSITGVLATLFPFVTLRGGGGDELPPTIAAILAAAFFWWLYKRAVKDLPEASAGDGAQ